MSEAPSTAEAAHGQQERRRAGPAEVGCSDHDRFLMELEFVQCLANPKYLCFLAQNQRLEEPELINYLKYLLYWKKPEYARYIMYPHALYFLGLLQKPEFRAAIADATYAEQVFCQQFFFWQHHRANGVKELAASAKQEEEATETGVVLAAPAANVGDGMDLDRPEGGES